MISIEVITMWYNEEYLARFFLNHYSFEEKVRIIVDEDTNDDTLNIISSYPNTKVEYIKFSDGFNNDVATARFNRCYRESKADWVILVDSDEFVLTPNLHGFLSERTEDIFMVRFYEVYRHKDDKDLDPNIPIAEQRKHGVISTDKRRTNFGLGCKPAVVKTGKRIVWTPGQHQIKDRSTLFVTAKDFLVGAHWSMADPNLIKRKLTLLERQSEHNIKVGHVSHLKGMTRDSLIEKLNSHLSDKEVL